MKGNLSVATGSQFQLTGDGQKNLGGAEHPALAVAHRLAALPQGAQAFRQPSVGQSLVQLTDHQQELRTGIPEIATAESADLGGMEVAPAWEDALSQLHQLGLGPLAGKASPDLLPLTDAAIQRRVWVLEGRIGGWIGAAHRRWSRVDGNQPIGSPSYDGTVMG